MNMHNATIEKLRNAYWRMDDALDGLQAGRTPAEMREAWKAHRLLADILKDTDPAWQSTVSPVPHYNPETDGDYSEWLAANNID